MKKRILLLGILAITSTLTITSCSDDDGFNVEQTQKSILTLGFRGENISTYKTLNIDILEINTGVTTTKTIENTNFHSLELPKGSYKITVNGEIISQSNETFTVGGGANIDIVSAVENVNIDLYVKSFNNDFIIEEVFFTGVKTPEGKNYNSSRYFKLTNNTDEVLFADQLIIGQSNFLTSVDNNVTPYATTEYFPVKGVMVLPGTGQQYPVQPGDFIVIADNAIDHNSISSTAFNLSNADFEFPNDNPALGNVDNPNVPNVDVIYTQMNFNMFFLHSSGVEAYVIARFPEGQDKTTFLANQKYDYEYTNSAGNITSKSAYKIPNSWIIDGMNNANEDKLLQLLTSPSIDAGWTSVGAFYNDPNRIGKSVRRNVIGKSATGKNVYKDTNNSTIDFNKNAEPSLKNGIVH